MALSMYGGGPSSAKKRKRSGSFRGPMGPRMRDGSFYTKVAISAADSENHYFDTERVTGAVPFSLSTWAASNLDPNTSAMLCLFAPTIGDDISSRTGRKIFVKSIRIRGAVTYAAQATQTLCDEGLYVRIVCFKDKQTNTGQATGDLVLSQGAASDAVFFAMSLANLGRFEILKEKIILVSEAPLVAGLTTAYVQPGGIRPFKMSIKLNDVVHYNATNGGTVADVVDNSYHIIALCNNQSLAPAISYKARTVFVG